MLADTELERPEALALIRALRKTKNMSIDDVAAKIGKTNVWVGALFSGQAMMTQPTAGALAGLLGCSVTDLATLTECPERNSDPFLYRLHEMMDVYGDSLRILTNEHFGDGILSAIDLKLSFERRGERAVIVMDAKFLPYKEF